MAKKRKSRRQRNQQSSSDSEPPKATLHPVPVASEETLKPLLDENPDLAHLLARNPGLALKISQTVIKQHSGPLPSPEVLEGYKRAHPGGVKVVFDQFEKQAEHAREIEAKVIAAKVSDLRWGRVIEMLGQGLAFLVVLIVMGIGAYVALELRGWAGAIFGSIF